MENELDIFKKWFFEKSLFKKGEIYKSYKLYDNMVYKILYNTNEFRPMFIYSWLKNLDKETFEEIIYITRKYDFDPFNDVIRKIRI